MYKVAMRYSRREAFKSYSIKNKKMSDRELCLQLSIKVPARIFEEMKADFKEVDKSLYKKGKPCLKVYNDICFKGHYAITGVLTSAFVFFRHLAGAAFTPRISIKPRRIIRLFS